MNIFGILAIIFSVLFFLSLVTEIVVLTDLLHFSNEKKQISTIIISTSVFFISILPFLTFVIINDITNTNAKMEELFIDSNYKETIEYLDFVNIDVNKTEITYSKTGVLFTMQYNYKADDFDVQDGIQVYVDSKGTVGIR